MTACPIRYQRQVPDRKGKIFYTSITSLSHISKVVSIVMPVIVGGILALFIHVPMKGIENRLLKLRACMIR